MAPILVLSATVLLILAGLNHSYSTAQCLKGDTCSGKGTCSDRGGGCFACSCTGDYEGNDCSGEPVCETDAQCGGHGKCRSNSCQCRNGYSGRVCTIAPICKPKDGTCGSNGKCSNCTNTCVCYKGYGGTKCEIAPICTKHSDCGDHGYCDYGENPYRCKCTDGYGGDKCHKAPYCTRYGFECGTRGSCEIRNYNGHEPIRCVCHDPTNTTPLCDSADIVHVTTSLIFVLIGSHLLM